MIRHVAAVTIALISSVTPVFAQGAAPIADLVVRTTADVHQAPTTASAVIGKAPGGTRLPINRNLGSWFEVAWPDAAGRVAFVHVNSGTIAAHSTVPVAAAPVVSETQAAIAQISAVAAAAARVNGGARAGQYTATSQVAAHAADYIILPQHQIGLGALLNTSTLRFGASTRVWWHRLGGEFSISRPDVTSADGQLIPSTQFAPSAMYALPEGATDSLWVRPYVGAGPRFYRLNLMTRFGYETFGGAEVTFAAIPQFALSAEMGYRWRRPALGDFTPQQTAFSLSGHWYVK